MKEITVAAYSTITSQEVDNVYEELIKRFEVRIEINSYYFEHL